MEEIHTQIKRAKLYFVLTWQYQSLTSIE